MLYSLGLAALCAVGVVKGSDDYYRNDYYEKDYKRHNNKKVVIEAEAMMYPAKDGSWPTPDSWPTGKPQDIDGTVTFDQSKGYGHGYNQKTTIFVDLEGLPRKAAFYLNIHEDANYDCSYIGHKFMELGYVDSNHRGKIDAKLFNDRIDLNGRKSIVGKYAVIKGKKYGKVIGCGKIKATDFKKPIKKKVVEAKAYMYPFEDGYNAWPTSKPYYGVDVDGLVAFNIPNKGYDKVNVYVDVEGLPKKTEFYLNIHEGNCKYIGKKLVDLVKLPKTDRHGNVYLAKFPSDRISLNDEHYDGYKYGKRRTNVVGKSVVIRNIHNEKILGCGDIKATDFVKEDGSWPTAKPDYKRYDRKY